jgi:hypothetical protein
MKLQALTALNIKKAVFLCAMAYSRAGQLQPTGRSHTPLRTRLRVAVAYTYIEGEEVLIY